MKAKRCALLCWALVLATGQPVQATTLFDNLAARVLAADPIAAEGPLGGSFWTDDHAYLLSSVALRLTVEAADFGTLTVSLYGDGGLGPGSALVVLAPTAGPSAASPTQTLTFQSDTGVQLLPLSRYWVVATSSSPALAWQRSADLEGPGVKLGERYASGALRPSTEGLYLMRVDAAPALVPVGGAGPFMLGALAVGHLLARRRAARGSGARRRPWAG